MSESTQPMYELSVEENISLTFSLYLKNFSVFFIPYLIFSIISALLSLPMLIQVEEITKIDFTGPPEVVWTNFWNRFLALMALAFVIAIISLIISSVVSGILIKSASEIIEKGKTSLSNSFKFAVFKLPSLLAASLIVGILTVLGLLLLIIPGIIIFIMFYLVIPVIVIEEKGALESLTRSRELVSNRWLKTFALSLIVGLIIGASALVINLILAPFGMFSTLAGAIISSVIAPISPISSTFYYYSMRAKEKSKRIPPPPPPPF
ncbi:MAG: hypothetical protein ACUVTB_00425 [Candidatus Bathycorpusculaceae bacterium]